MADGTKQAVGLSVGTTTLAAVTADNAVRRAPVLTVGGTPDRPLTITDFVDRVGDPVGIIAPDGSTHRAEKVLADALREVAFKASRGQPLPELTAVTVPAHWRPAAVDALTRALARIPEWSRQHPAVLPDVVAAVTALQADPGLPTRGVIALCDFGGSGTSITLVDAGNGYQPIGPTVRDVDFSGDLIDQALLSHVISELAGAGSVDLTSTSAIGSLWRLRTACRDAKERLSTRTVTAMPVELPEFHGEIRITRVELDDVLRAPLAVLLEVLQDTLQRNGIHPTDLSAVASVGGCAGIAAVTTTLSEHLRVPVITSPRPALIQATGAALRALRGPADDSATALSRAPMAGMAPATQAAPVAVGNAAAYEPASAVGPADPLPALAWSEAYDDLDESVAAADPGLNSLTGARPQLEFEVDDDPALAEDSVVRWYRRPLAVMAASTLVILAAIGGIGVVLMNDSSAVPASVPSPSVSTTPEVPAPVAQPAPEPAAAPAPQPGDAALAPRTVVATAAPVTQVIQQQAPPPAPAPAAPQPAPAVTETITQTVAPPSEEPAPQQQAPAPAEPAPSPSPAPAPSPSATPPAQQWIPTIPPIPTIPGLPPFIPQLQVPIP